MVRRRLFIVWLMLTATGGCDRTPGAKPGAPAAVTRAAEGPGVALFDQFEGERIADFWLPPDYGTGLYRPGAISVTREVARSGRGAVKITVTEGDVASRGDDGRWTERAELDSGHLRLLGRDAWYGYAFLVPKDFPVVDDRLVIASWKQSDVEGSPLIGQRYRRGRHTLTIRPPGVESDEAKDYRLPEIRPGRWHDMVCHVRYSAGDDGTIEVWMDGARAVLRRSDRVAARRRPVLQQDRPVPRPVEAADDDLLRRLRAGGELRGGGSWERAGNDQWPSPNDQSMTNDELK